MPASELKNLPLANDPRPTHGAADGELMEYEGMSMEEMLAVVKTKKETSGDVVAAPPHEGDTILTLPAVGEMVPKAVHETAKELPFGPGVPTANMAGCKCGSATKAALAGGNKASKHTKGK